MIDPKLQAELRAQFNPDGSELRKMQLRMLEMLKYIDKICCQNNIKYWLSSGTCLGAVRHGGFIPWDDDLDIEMELKDYKKLKKCILSDTTRSYDWQDSHTDSYFPCAFAKLRDRESIIEENNDASQYYEYKGIFIDIFALTPSNSKILRKLGNSIYYRITKSLHRIKSEKVRKIINTLLSYVYIPITESIQHLGTAGKLRHITGSTFLQVRYAEDFKNIKFVKFEDTISPIPSNERSYLHNLYGDYSNLPDFSNLRIHTQRIEYSKTKTIFK